MFLKHGSKIIVVFVLMGCMAGMFSYPREAKAIVPTWDWGLSGPTLTAPLAWFYAKEAGPHVFSPLALFTGQFSLDGIAWWFARLLLDEFTKAIILWIQTGQDPFFSGGTEGTLFVTNIDEFLLDAADNAAGVFLHEYWNDAYDFLCTPFRFNVGVGIGHNYGRDYGSFRNQARCSITDIVGNLEDFYNDFSNGGWEAWFSTAQYANNPLGLLTLSLNVDIGREHRAVKANSSDFLAGLGFPGMRKCVKGINPVTGKVVDNPTFSADSPLCLRAITQTPGKAIEDQLADSFGQEIHKLEAADEINEILAAALSELVSWLIGGGSGGGGLLGRTSFPEPDPGDRTPQCSDGIDNDFDSLIDLADPGCTSSSDPTEGGSPLPSNQCTDGIDNDGDGLIDAADPQCVGGSTSESGSTPPPPPPPPPPPA